MKYLLLFLIPSFCFATVLPAKESMSGIPESEYFNKHTSIDLTFGLGGTENSVGLQVTEYFQRYFGVELGADLKNRSYTDSGRLAEYRGQSVDYFLAGTFRVPNQMTAFETVAFSIGVFNTPAPHLNPLSSTALAGQKGRSMTGLYYGVDLLISLTPRSDWGYIRLGFYGKAASHNAVDGAGDNFEEMGLRLGLGGIF